jgi:hypothetical protein
VLRHYNKIDDDNVVCAKLPATAPIGFLNKPKAQLYKDKKLWPYLGKFYKNLHFTDNNGNEFQVQKIRDTLVDQFDDITNNEGLELFARVQDYHLGNGLEIIKILVVIPAYVFDQLPDNPIGKSLADDEKDDEKEEEKQEEYNLLAEVELDAYTFAKNIGVISEVFGKWSTYQGVFHNVQGGRVKQTSLLDSQKQINFYIKRFKQPTKKFADSLKKLLYENEFELTDNKSHPQAAEKIKITFNLPTETRPYSIDKVEAKYKNCDYESCTLAMEPFKQEAWCKHPTVLNYIAQSEESANIMQVMRSAPWLDWVEKYTYPRTTINYSSDVLDCIEAPPDTSDTTDDQIIDIDLDFGQMLEWFMNQMNCKTLTDMQDYDPIRDLEKMRGKFTKLIDKKVYTQNSFVKDLFGLPIDWKSVGKKSAIDVVSEFFKRASLCNIATLLFEILKCLFGTFSLDEMFGIIVERILLAAGIPLFKIVWEATPAVITDVAASQAKLKLAGFEMTPWDYYDEKLIKDKDAGKYLVWLAGADEKAQNYIAAPLDEEGNQLTGRPDGLGGAGAPKPNIEKVFETWLKQYLVNIEDMDKLLELIKDFPGAGILKVLVATFACPSQHLLKNLLSELKGILNLGAINPFCDLGEAWFRMPSIPTLPSMEWKALLRSLLMILIKKLIDLLASLLLSIVLKMLSSLSCEGIADFLKNGAREGDDKALEDAVSEILCPDDDDEDLAGDGNPSLDDLLELLDNQGISGPPEDVMPMAADISALAGKNEFKKAFITPPDEQDPDFCSMIAEMTNARHPQYSPVLGTPDDVAFFFSGIGNLLSADQKETIANSIIDADDDEPIDSSICPTKEKKDRWNSEKKSFIDQLCGNLPMSGFRPEDTGDNPTEEDMLDEPTLADDWLDKINKERSPSALADAMDLFINGPASGIGEALDEALSMAAPNCKYDPETGEAIEPDEPGSSDNKSIVPPMPEEVTAMVDEAKKSVYGTVESAFTYDLIGGYNSFFNHLFADTFNHTFYSGTSYRPSHKTAEKAVWFYPNAANTLDQWQEKWDGVKERTFSIKRLLMKTFAPETDLEGNEIEDHNEEQFATHLYPETIAIWMRTKMMEQADEIIAGGFATDMGIAKQGGLKSTTPTRYDWQGTEKDWNYKRRKWDLEKMVTYSWMSPTVPNPEMKMKFRDNNSGLGGWSYGFDLSLINYTLDDNNNQVTQPSYRLILDEFESTNVPAGSSWLTRLRSVEDDGTILLKGAVTDAAGETEVIEADLSSIKQSRDRYFDVEVKTDPGNALEILPLYSEASPSDLSSYNYPGIVFKNYVNSVYRDAGIVGANLDNSYLAKTLFDEMNNYVYSNVLKAALNTGGEDVTVGDTTFENVPDSFKFGYTDDRITKADLTYVTPAATSDEATWEYDHDNDEKILGKSATGNPRIEFLDPEVHGGRYTRPKIYISPAPYTGWLGLSQIVIPEDDNHEPKRKAFIFTDEIAEKEKDWREDIPYDERLNDEKQCLQERAYDILNEPSGHAGLHSSVILTARLYAFEHMIKSMSIYKILKVDFKKNYDESVLAAVVEDMEEQMQDIPDRGRRRGYYKGYNYWLLFLEQSVQAVERKVTSGDIKMTQSLAEKFQELKGIRESMTVMGKKDIKWLKYVSKVTWSSAGEIESIQYGYAKGLSKKRKHSLNMAPPTVQDARIRELIQSVMFYSFGKNFKSILAGETRDFAYRMRRRQRNMFKMANKLYTIHRTKAFAKQFLRFLIADELSFYQEKFSKFLEPKPTIADMRKYFFGSSGLIITPLNGGLTEEEVETSDVFDYGSNVKHVVKDPITENPTMFFTSTEQAKLLDESPLGNFYIEKYLRIVEKPRSPLPSNQNPNSSQSVIGDRDNLLKEVVNIEEFQNWLSENIESLAVPHAAIGDEEDHAVRISDLFGDAVPIYQDPTPEEIAQASARGEEDPKAKLIGYDGSTGIKFGVRLCYIPKSDFEATVPTSRAIREKSFKLGKSTYIDEDDNEVDTYPSHNVEKIFPIASYERDILDRDLIDLDLNDDDFGEELNCYIDELIKSPQVSLLFDFCFPLRRAASLMALYCNYAFIPSIGEDSTERDIVNGRAPTQRWKGKTFRRTKHNLRQIFVSNYRAVAWATFMIKDDIDPRDKNRRKFKMQFGANMPQLGYEFGGWRIGRRVVDRPYDMNGDPEEPDDGAI